ncbi:MAG TPA: isochorismatase family cysteine hydrolase [Thermoanaerobaculia bacterium]|nr:isochorismatase family cysteine hydrolase [Thermoanaerobaculia bacterium]
MIDVINDLDDVGEDLLNEALPAARRIAKLKRRAKAAGVPAIYVNDNFGRWQSDFQSLIKHVLKEGGKGRALVQLLRPEEDDYFILKPKYSGFYSTTLDLLLRHLGVRRLILTGFAGNICVLFTANDAFLRDYDLLVPSDCTASNTHEENEQALSLMRTVLKAETTSSVEIDLEALVVA